MEDQAYVPLEKIAEAIAELNGEGNEHQEVLAFVRSELVQGWLKAVEKRVEKKSLYPKNVAEFLARAYYLVQLGADLQLINLIVNRPYLVIGLIAGLADALETMGEENEDEDEAT